MEKSSFKSQRVLCQAPKVSDKFAFIWAEKVNCPLTKAWSGWEYHAQDYMSGS